MNDRADSPRAVVLLSGGLDSATALAMAVDEGFECHTLALDYGQRHRAELDAAAAHPHWSLGMLYARQASYPEAIPLFEKLIEIAPLDFQVHLFLGHLYTRTGRQDEADAQFETYSRNKRAHHLQKTARREFEAQIEEIFGG